LSDELDVFDKEDVALNERIRQTKEKLDQTKDLNV